LRLELAEAKEEIAFLRDHFRALAAKIDPQIQAGPTVTSIFNSSYAQFKEKQRRARSENH
jgi:hypothetical protein